MSSSTPSVSLVTSSPLLSDCIAQQIRAFRKRRDLTLAQLAEQCDALGAPQLSMSALANIERGQTGQSKRRRRDVSVDELTVLAKALQVPPLLLLFPVGSVDAVSILPTQTLDTWRAAQWFTGEGYMAEDQATHYAVPLYLFRQHDRFIGDYLNLLTDRLFPPTGPDDLDEGKRQKRADYALSRLRDVRAEMRRHGLTPPALAEDLRHVDERRHVYLTPEEVEEHAARNPGDVRFVDRNRPGRGPIYRPGDAERINAQRDQADPSGEGEGRA